MGSQPESRLSRRIMEAFRARGAFVFKVQGGPSVMAGLPDITGVYKRYSIWVETKMPGGTVSAVQELRHEAIRKSGGQVIVAHNVTEALALLDRIDARINRARVSRGN